MSYLNKVKGLLFNIVVLVGLFQSCRKDPGNYVYTELNKTVVTGLDTVYEVSKGNYLSITPNLSYTKDPVGDTSNYKYSWLKFVPGGPVEIASGPIFRRLMNDNTGQYNCGLRVTDKKTGVWNEFLFKVFISIRTYEGWYVLSEVAGNQSRLDMLSYKNNTGRYQLEENVLAASNSSLGLTGRPSFVTFMNGAPYSPRTNGTTDALIVGTSTMATFVGVDTLQYEDRFNFNYWASGGTNVAIGPDAKYEAYNGKTFILANGVAYAQRNTSNSHIAVNTITGNTTPFKVAPFVSTDRFGTSRDAIFFNETASEFVSYINSARSCVRLNTPETLFPVRINKDLLYMRFTSYNNGGETFAILKDKGGSRVYLARFTAGSQNYYAEITNTPIAQAEKFEISDDFGYIFYSIGGKLYEYDFNLKLNKEILDFGSRKISLLKFQYLNTGTNQRYINIRKRLCVATYDESNLNNSGTLELYTVPPINGALVKEESFSGLGKIVSITYRTR